MIYKFHNIEIDTKNYRLLDSGKVIAVEPQVFNLIVLLLENKKNVVSRDEILDKLWNGRVVSDTSINNHIKSARKALGDDGKKQAVIKTIHSRGYQFVAEITDDTSIVKTEERTFKSKIFRSNFLALAAVILLTFFAIKYYQSQELTRAVQKIAKLQEITYATFVAQAKRRNELVYMIEARTGEKREMQFEKYFSYYYPQLNTQEKFVFEQIRAMTNSGLYRNNLKIVALLNNNPKIILQIKDTRELLKHLTFWLNKYQSVFSKREDMCLLYVGVEDGIPYPIEVNANIKKWLQGKNKESNVEIEKNPEYSTIDIENTKVNNKKMIAVLPFSNSKPDSSTDYLGFALANQIINELSYINQFSVLPAASVKPYEDSKDPIGIAKTLQVNYILSGNYLKENGLIRLNIEFIQVDNSQLIWRESMQVDYSNTFTLQDLVSQRVFKGLDVDLRQDFFHQKEKDIPKNALAYEYYLQGTSYPYTNTGHKLAIKMFDKSIELDPPYAPAYAQLGLHLRLYEQHGLVSLKREHGAKWCFQKALQLNPELFMALKNLAAYYVETNQVEEAYELAQKLKKIAPDNVDTHYTFSYIYRYAGMNDAAINEIEAALALSPNNPRLATIIPIYMAAGLPQKALSYLSIASPPYANIHGGIIEYNLGNINNSKVYFQNIIDDKEGGVWELYANFYLALITNETDKARGYINQITESKIVDGENFFNESICFALLGDKENSIKLLEKAVNIGFFNYPYIRSTPEFKILSDEPRFKVVLNNAKQRHEEFREKLFINN